MRREHVGLGAVAVGRAAAFFGLDSCLGWLRPAPAPGIGASGRPAIAVMEFESLTGDKERQWLARGLPSMLTTDLAQTPGVTDRIRAGLDVGDRPAGRSLAEVTTTSLEAYRFCIEGMEALRNMRPTLWDPDS